MICSVCIIELPSPAVPFPSRTSYVLLHSRFSDQLYAIADSNMSNKEEIIWMSMVVDSQTVNASGCCVKQMKTTVIANTMRCEQRRPWMKELEA